MKFEFRGEQGGRITRHRKDQLVGKMEREGGAIDDSPRHPGKSIETGSYQTLNEQLRC